MSDFSTAARRLAARMSAPPSPSRTPETEGPTEHKRSLDSVPLDRKRGVKFETMSDEDLERALSQAEKRVNRTKTSATRDRYELQLASIKAEIHNRGLRAAEEKLREPEEQDENAPLPPRGPSKPQLPPQDPPPEPPRLKSPVPLPDDDEDLPRQRPGLPPSEPMPGDTPEADVPLI